MKKLASLPEWAIKMACDAADVEREKIILPSRNSALGRSIEAHARTIYEHCDEPEEPEFRAMRAALEIRHRGPVQTQQVLDALEVYRKALA